MGPPRTMREVENAEDWRVLEGIFRRQWEEHIEKEENVLVRPREVAMSKYFL